MPTTSKPGTTGAERRSIGRDIGQIATDRLATLCEKPVSVVLWRFHFRVLHMTREIQPVPPNETILGFLRTVHGDYKNFNVPRKGWRRWAVRNIMCRFFKHSWYVMTADCHRVYALNALHPLAGCLATCRDCGEVWDDRCGHCSPGDRDFTYEA